MIRCHGDCNVANGNQQSCIIQKKHDSSVASDVTESSELVMCVAIVTEMSCCHVLQKR